MAGQSSHPWQLPTHTQRSLGSAHDPSSLHAYGGNTQGGTHTGGPQSSQNGQLAVHWQSRPSSQGCASSQLHTSSEHPSTSNCPSPSASTSVRLPSPSSIIRPSAVTSRVPFGPDVSSICTPSCSYAEVDLTRPRATSPTTSAPPLSPTAKGTLTSMRSPPTVLVTCIAYRPCCRSSMAKRPSHW